MTRARATAGAWFRLAAAALVVGSLLLLGTPRAASAQDADTREVQRYTLTDAAFTKYARATEALAALEADCEEEEDDSEARSIAEMVAALEAMPGAGAALQSAGMAPREYVVFSMSLLQNGLAAFAASQPGGTLPPGISQANVDFIARHNAELERLGELRSESCGEAD
jgi:hypothetical protein